MLSFPDRPDLIPKKASNAVAGNDAAAFYDPLYDRGEKLKQDDVSNVGYRFTARFINIGTKYKLYELLPLRSDQPANFCFLTLNAFKQRGVIVKDSFQEHKNTLAAMSVPKEKILNIHPIAKQQIEPQGNENHGQQTGGALAEHEGNAAALNRRALE